MLLKTDNDGQFTVEDLIDSVPGSLMVGRPNPAPAEQED